MKKMLILLFALSSVTGRAKEFKLIGKIFKGDKKCYFMSSEKENIMSYEKIYFECRSDLEVGFKYDITFNLNYFYKKCSANIKQVNKTLSPMAKIPNYTDYELYKYYRKCNQI